MHSSHKNGHPFERTDRIHGCTYPPNKFRNGHHLAAPAAMPTYIGTSEVDAVLCPRIAGRTDKDIRKLVQDLVKARQETMPPDSRKTELTEN